MLPCPPRAKPHPASAEGAMTDDQAGLPPMPADVADAFDAFPKAARRRLLQVRRLIFETAAKLDGVGPLTETLKWGEPAYLTEATGSGSTIRLGVLRSSDQACVLFNCRTSLVEAFRTQFPATFTYEKNRGILLNTPGKLPQGELVTCLAMALTYRQRRRLSKSLPKAGAKAKPIKAPKGEKVAVLSGGNRIAKAASRRVARMASRS
jgi:hypothetical protein